MKLPIGRFFMVATLKASNQAVSILMYLQHLAELTRRSGLRKLTRLSLA